MLIYSIDLETTGVDSKLNDILTIGAVISELEDERLTIKSYFNKVFFKRNLTISSGAYKINKELLDWYYDNNEKHIALQSNNAITDDELYYLDIAKCLDSELLLRGENINDEFRYDNLLIIGKNYDKFDREFLLSAIDNCNINEIWYAKNLNRLLNRTSYDIGIACMRIGTDTKTPNTEECLERLKVEYSTDIRHHSMYDAYLMTKAFANLNGFVITNEISDSMFLDYMISSKEIL